MAKILIVDDEPANRQLLVAVLSHRGHTFLEAENGLEALRIVREEPLELVITDLSMPGIDGTQLLRELRRMGGGVTAILYTATRPGPMLDDFMLVTGVRHAIVKPAEAQEILRVVDAALAEREAEKKL